MSTEEEDDDGGEIRHVRYENGVNNTDGDNDAKFDQDQPMQENK